METKKMKIEYRKQIDSETAPWQLLTNIDELIWNGVYALRVSDDNGLSNLPFRLANDDTVTFVVKDHAHEGMLENGRTIVQTITRVERTTGDVFVYTRTRCNVNGTPTWSYWALSTEGEAVIEMPKATNASLGGVIIGDGLYADANGKLSLAQNAVAEKNLTSALAGKINNGAEAMDFVSKLVLNEDVVLHIGTLVENSTPYTGSNYRAYTDKIYANGEPLFVNAGYKISACKIFEGENEVAFFGNLDDEFQVLEEKGCYYQFEFAKKDNYYFSKDELPKVVKLFRRNPIVWGEDSSMDKLQVQGTYTISGNRINKADGLPILNTGVINARLAVLASENCVTQILTLLNVSGGDGNIYVRTCQNGQWEMWGKLQTNIDVGAIGLGQGRTFDSLIDNGIYSGANVLATGVGENGYPLTDYENFVLIVINGYLTGGGIAQLKYSQLPDGTSIIATRTRLDDEWSEWKNIDTVTTASIQDGAVTTAKLSAGVRDKLENPLRPLYLAAGALYNGTAQDIQRTAPWGETVSHKPGHYYLNGLGDITEEQMQVIYSEKSLLENCWKNRGCQFSKARTLFPAVLDGQTYLKDYYSFGGLVWAFSYNLEILKFGFNQDLNDVNSASRIPVFTNSNQNALFFSCRNLQVVYPLNVVNVTVFLDTNFEGCFQLKEIRLFNLKTNISFKDCSKISNQSLLYIINNAVPTSAISITLHPDAYARLASDTDIVAALEAQPLVSLVSA